MFGSKPETNTADKEKDELIEQYVVYRNCAISLDMGRTGIYIIIGQTIITEPKIAQKFKDGLMIIDTMIEDYRDKASEIKKSIMEKYNLDPDTVTSPLREENTEQTD